MLETVREFGLDQLTASGETEAARDAHARWFLSQIALGAHQQRTTPERWRTLVQQDRDNLRAAQDWLCEQGQTAQAVRSRPP